ncbi:hypothetical protein TGAMA5MH_00260 [Trichoderma gamsii]|uniref:Uncharacterized protein n=1 Tax=Trichoderma gamsii TaxID=398673 RepID=A0A2K0TTF4_9HYPO|nr:hypothetical protein TGAMA5MH_00260 [Trichoderma gamsii]
MLPISKITAAIASATQETSFALANINFDFSICKFEAPEEYRGVGQHLSERRIRAAEDGDEHKVARKFGALFSHILPSTPQLVTAYGKRSSQITEISSKKGLNNGPFQDWVGPDGTSIWAAATSGPGAIAVHLLACMLARIWPAREAVAIWEEIIAGRKAELSRVDQTDPSWVSASLATRIEITYDQISSWDASARSWLQVADVAKLRQQRQLELLASNITIPVSQKPSTYSSVLEAWTTGLRFMENLVSGLPQSVQSGSEVLALTSWHLYPNITVLGAGNPRPVAQRDELIPPGAMITLGQLSCSPDRHGEVFWSLPLAYLKYYGDPIVTSRSIGETSSRLTLAEFFLVVLGSVFSGLRIQGADIDKACDLFIKVTELVNAASPRRSLQQPRPWIEHLAEAAKYYKESNPVDEYKLGLIMRGHRRYKKFLTELAEEPSPLSDLFDANILLRLMTESENKIKCLRLLAQDMVTQPNALLIRYPKPRSESKFDEHFEYAKLDEYLEAADFSKQKARLLRDVCDTWEFATATTRSQNPEKGRVTPDSDGGHIRWMKDSGSEHNGEEIRDLSMIQIMDRSDSIFSWSEEESLSFTSSFRPFDAISSPLYERILGDPNGVALFKRYDAEIAGSSQLSVDALLLILSRGWVNNARLLQLLDSSSTQCLDSLRYLAAAADVYKLMPSATISVSVFSKPLVDAVWMKGSSMSSKISDPETDTPSQELRDKGSFVPGASVDPRQLFESDSDISLATSNFFETWGEQSETSVHDASSEHHRSKRIKYEADKHQVNSEEQGPKPDLYPESDPESDRWITGLRTYELSRPQTFACIAMFENRDVNLQPESLKKVMALSAGNSIYVAMPLICDPFECPKENEVKHVIGNIGKPGVSLMIPPVPPKRRIVDEYVWKTATHALFDGRLDDAFKDTSLHLSFTKYKLPVKFSHGYQSVEGNFVETLISVLDKQEWVADLDILSAIDESRWERMPSPSKKKCQHEPGEKKPGFKLTSIDSWDEFLDKPYNSCIFRASNNWLARLSAAALNANLGSRTIVLDTSKSPCWDCLGDLSNGILDELSRDPSDGKVPLIIH